MCSGTPGSTARRLSVEILEDYRPVYDIIFLDVEMQHLDGMETARRIRELDSDVLLIFITNMAQYAIKGYAVGALDYVLKPVPYFAFSQQLQKAVNQLAKRTRYYLAVPADGGMRRLDAATIYYIESEGHRVHFYTEDGDFSAPGALKALEDAKAELGFQEVIYNESVGKLSLVGAGMKTNPGVSFTFFEALSSAGVNIDMISTSEIRISVITELSKLDEAVRAVHTAFGLDTEGEATVYGGTGR